MKVRVGFGYDVHALVPERDLWLGGVKIEHTMGLQGHSDADVLIHAICDALLGAANMRDIGYHFPDTAGEYKDIDSKILLFDTMELLRDAGYTLGNIDATVAAERPKLNPHIPEMKRVMADVLQVDVEDISIKATTTEKLGFTGRQEGIAAYATVLIQESSTASRSLSLIVLEVPLGLKFIFMYGIIYFLLYETRVSLTGNKVKLMLYLVYPAVNL